MFCISITLFFLVASSNLISQLPIASINSTTLGAHSFREPPRGKIINHTPLHGRTMSGDCPIFHLFEGLLLLLTITITPKVHFPNHKWCNLCFSLIFHYPQMLKILKLVPLFERYSLPEQQPLEREIHARFPPTPTPLTNAHRSRRNNSQRLISTEWAHLQHDHTFFIETKKNPNNTLQRVTDWWASVHRLSRATGRTSSIKSRDLFDREVVPDRARVVNRVEVAS